jgi:signal peptidase I
VRRSLKVRNLLIVVGVIAWAIFLRPQWLGGPATFVLVRGDSMVPTYENGDFLLVYPQADYGVGDIVAYKVPTGQVGAGHLVVHRISAVSAAGLELQGDNNPAQDPWTATTADLVGEVVVRVPGVGVILAFALQPIIAAGLASACVVMFGAARATRPPQSMTKLRR